MARPSSILAWKIPWAEELGGLQSMGSQRVRHNWMSDSMHANAKFSSENVNKYTFYQKSPPEFINFEGHWLLLVLT